MEEERVSLTSSRRASSDWLLGGRGVEAVTSAGVGAVAGGLWCRASGRVAATTSTAAAAQRAGRGRLPQRAVRWGTGSGWLVRGRFHSRVAQASAVERKV